MARRTLVIGDVHGCLGELEALLAAVAHAPSDDLWFVGDLVDRGPDSAGVVALARRLGARLVRGNHDDKHVRWRRHAEREAADPRRVNPMRANAAFLAVDAALSGEDVAWLDAAPAVAQLSAAWVVVHGGLAPGDTPGDARLPMNLRHLDGETGKPLRHLPDVPLADGAVHWSERWEGPWKVIYGHHARPAVAVRPWSFGIDTGAVYGGHLTAAVLESLELGAVPRFVSVPAARAWRPHAAWPEAAARLLAEREAAAGEG